MTDDPRWHGWATPQQVREMFVEMWQWLILHNEDGELRLYYEGPGSDWTFKPEKDWYEKMIQESKNASV